MTKLPFQVYGIDVYSDLEFKDLESLQNSKHWDALNVARVAVYRKMMKVEKLIIVKHQVIALPPSEFDQRLLSIANLAGTLFNLSFTREEQANADLPCKP